jgi:hypothetical protein
VPQRHRGHLPAKVRRPHAALPQKNRRTSRSIITARPPAARS